MSMQTGLFQASDVTSSASIESPSAVPNPLRRIMSWYAAKVQAERDAEIAAFVAERGGKFTDEMEREISRRFGGLAG
jgi:hypothetical protein